LAEMIIGAPRVVDADGYITYSSLIRLPGEEFEMWFRGPSDVLMPRGADAFLIVCLTTAMERGLPLVVEAPVSGRLLAAARSTVQDIYRCWFPELTKVPIQAGERHADSALRASSAATFFSGGVDSFYTAYRHLDEISTLVLVHGFDLPLGKAALRAKVSERLTAVAAVMGRRLVEIETNCRDLTDRFVSWPDHQFGPALASVAVLLGGIADRVFIPSSETYAHLDPCGSHPLLDPLWSTEEVQILHDGADASRKEKIELLAQHPQTLSSLRVCWENPDDSYNCGRCEKCIRTMINLETAGALEKCGAFDAVLDPAVVARMTIPSDLVSFHVIDNLRELRQQGRNPVLVRALDRAVTSYRVKSLVRDLLALTLVGWLELLGVIARRFFFGILRRLFGVVNGR
jgi:hypothetical protein